MLIKNGCYVAFKLSVPPEIEYLCVYLTQIKVYIPNYSDYDYDFRNGGLD